ncbi:MAG TPA: D-alanine--D-alanine ligase [Candidatus Paceibacterota bacterium]|jgi:D-alanine-D-alanine ligase|nr:D-alanine--D-alanine ligase [Candidatus Paceibacterota bacterium]
MSRKIRVAILFGGKSAEHEVSVRSARNIAEALDRSKYEVTLIGITKSGAWLPPRRVSGLIGTRVLRSKKERALVALAPEGKGALIGSQEGRPFDVVFPVLHGPFGEDGTVQGLLRLANVPFVGAGVLGSAVGMDKDVMKRLLREAGIPIGKFLVARSAREVSFAVAKKKLGLPLFIKPANLGSSVGVSKVRTASEYAKALREALRYDTKVIIEAFIKGREIECSVLGNEEPIASVPGEIVVHSEFYSYETKYIDENGASLEIPAQLPKPIVRKIQELAIKTFKTLACEGMGRVDFFLTPSGKLYVNEINTIPGFTNISMYPKLWEASGIPYSKLINKLIALAIERFEKQQRLKTSR